MRGVAHCGVQGAVADGALGVDSRRRHTGNTDGVAAFGQHRRVPGIRGEARVRTVRHTPAPHRIVDFNQGPRVRIVRNTAHAEPAGHTEHRSVVVDVIDEPERPHEGLLRNGYNKPHDILGRPRYRVGHDVPENGGFKRRKMGRYPVRQGKTRHVYGMVPPGWRIRPDGPRLDGEEELLPGHGRRRKLHQRVVRNEHFDAVYRESPPRTRVVVGKRGRGRTGHGAVEGGFLDEPDHGKSGWRHQGSGHLAEGASGRKQPQHEDAEDQPPFRLHRACSLSFCESPWNGLLRSAES